MSVLADQTLSRPSENKTTAVLTLAQGQTVSSESFSGTEIDSTAFRRAQLSSERVRILIVVSALLAIVLLHTMRMFVLHAPEDSMHLLAKVVFVSLFVVYKVVMLRFVSRTLQTGINPSPLVWVADIIIETSLPALGIVVLTSSIIAPSYRPLANPFALIFFLFIIVSVLRLNPWSSWLSGVVAGVSYLCASYHLGWRPFLSTHISISSPERIVFSYALAFLVAGGLSAAVALEVRSYVQAALREAETRRVMERLEHDMKIARSIQQSLLPTTAPSIRGFQIAGCSFSADATGGDFFDWQILPSGDLLVVLADVTGHGLGPAMLAAGCRAYARANFAIQDGLLPALTRINAALSQDMTPGRFATLVAVLCMPGSSRVELLSAGHGPLCLYRAREDRMELLGSQAIPLGLMPVFNSDPPQLLDLNPGDLLVLVTDGLYEWENKDGEQFGVARLEPVIRRVSKRTPHDIIAALYTAVRKFSGGTVQLDDVTAVLIKRTV